MYALSEVEEAILDSVRILEWGILLADERIPRTDKERECVLETCEKRLIDKIREFGLPAEITVVDRRPVRVRVEVTLPAGRGKKDIKLT